MVHNINTGKPVDVKKEAEKVEKIKSTKKANSFWHDVKVAFWSGLVVTVIFLIIYLIPRWRAYVNAIRISHTHPEIIEEASVDEITKKVNMEITMSK